MALLSLGSVNLYNAHGTLIGNFNTVQDAVDAAGSIAGANKVIVVDGLDANGNDNPAFQQQVIVNGTGADVVAGSLDGLTLQGINGAVLQAPTTALVSTATDPNGLRDLDGVLTIENASGVKVEGLTIDGANEGANFVGGQNNATEVGIAAVNANGVVIGGAGDDAVTVENVREGDSGFGNQRGLGIYVSNSAADDSYAATVQDTTVENFQKNGITVKNAVATVENNHVVGTVNNVIAQNGIEIAGTSLSFGGATGAASGVVSGNTITNIGLMHDYGDHGDSGSGILSLNANGLTISDNTVTLATYNTATSPTVTVGQSISTGGPFNDGIDAIGYGAAQGGVTINNNTVTGAGSTGDVGNPGIGIDYQNGTAAGSVSNNQVNGFSIGVENDLDNNGAGGTATAGTSAPTISGNSFGSDIATAFFQGDGSFTPTPASVASGSNFASPGPGQVYVTDGHGNVVVDSVFSSIQAAIDAASTGDVIEVGAGTYNENVTINTSGLTIVGQGDSTIINGAFLSDNNIPAGETVDKFLQTATAYTGASGSGVSINASDTTIQNIAIQSFLHGVELGDGADATALTGVDITNTVIGVNKATTAGISGLTVTGGTISDGYNGIEFDKNTTSGQSGVGNADDVVVDGTHFVNLLDKGIYAETLSNSDIDDVVMSNVGQWGRAITFGGANANTGNGIDLNLKNGVYGDDTIQNFTLTDTGSSNENGVASAGGPNAGAIVLETRNDGSYAATPASYSGTLNVENGSISGTSTGIQVGEPGKANTGPTVSVTGVTITGADNSSGLHGDIANASTAILTFNIGDGPQTIKADPNSTGSIVFNVGDGDDAISGDAGVDTVQGYSAGATLSFNGSNWIVTDGGKTDTLSNIDKVVIGGVTHDLVSHTAGGGFSTIQAALNAAGSGDIINVTSGTYDESLSIAKAVTIEGNYAGLNGDDASRMAADETIITGQSSISTSGDVTIDGVEFLDNAALSNPLSSSDQFVSLEMGSSSGHDVIENSVFNRAPTDDTLASSTTFAGSSKQPTARGIEISSVASGGNVDVQNNLFTGDNPYPYAGNDWRSAVYSNGGAGTTNISGNTFENTRSAINADNFSPTVAISNNDFVNPGSAISVGVGSDVANVSSITNNMFGRVDTDMNFTNLTTPVSFDAAATGNSLSASAATAGETFEVDPGLNGGSYAGTAQTNTIGLENFSSPFTINLASGTITGPAVTSPITISNFQNAIGGGGNDTFTGDGVSSELTGGGGVDTVDYAGATTDDLSVVDGNWTINGAGGKDTLIGIAKVDNGSGHDILLVGDGGYATIQAAVNAASAGDTIDIAAGTYNGDVTIATDDLTIIGQGDQTKLEGTFKSANGIADGGVAAFLEAGNPYTQSSPDSGFTVSATGDTLRNLNLDGYTYGVFLSNGANGTTLSGVDVTDSLVGLHKGTTAGVDGLTIQGGSFSDGLLGVELDKNTTPGGGAIGNASNVLIDGTSFDDLVIKGIYAETLSNSTIDDVTMMNVGQFGAPITSNASDPGNGGNGIDLNLKNGTYADDTIENFTLTNTGASTGGSALGDKNGGAVVVEARNDGATYSAAPATYTGAVTIENGTINGSSTGVQVGEPGKSNTGPAANVSNVTITGALDNSLHGEFGNSSLATMTITLPAAGGTYSASGNTTGPINITGSANADTITTGGGDDTITGGGGDDVINGGAGIDTAVYSGDQAAYSITAGAGKILVADTRNGSPDGTDTLTGIEKLQFADHATLIVGGDSAYTTIQSAVDAASAGDTILIAGGVYNENVTINKDNLTIENVAGQAVTINGTGGYAGAMQIAQGVSGTTIESSDSNADDFVLQGASGGELAGLYLTGGNSNTLISGVTVTAAPTGVAGHNAVITGGGLSNITFQNDVFSGPADQLVYVNGYESVGQQDSNVNFINNTFSGSAPLLLGIEAGGGSVQGNLFSGTGDTAIGLAEAGMSVSGNTFDTGISSVYFGGDGSYSPQAIISGNTYPASGAYYLTGSPGEDGVFASVSAALAYAHADDTIFGSVSPIPLNSTQATALEAAGVDVSGPSVILEDTAADIQALTAAQIAGLVFAGINEVQATDGSVTLTAAKAVAFENAGLKLGVPTGDSVTLSDTAAHINAMTTAQIAALGATGVTVVNVTDNSLALSAAHGAAFGTAGVTITVPGGDTITVADTAANIAAALDGLNSASSVSKIIVTDSSVNEVTITAQQGVNDGTALGKLYNSDGTTPAHAAVSDNAVNFATYVGGLNADIDAIYVTSGSGTLLDGTTIGVPKLSESGAGTTLTIAGNVGYSGAFTQGAGSKVIINKTETLTLSGANSLSGSTFGGGTLALTGGSTAFSTGASLSTSFWSLSGSAAVTLNGPITYTGAFSAGAGTQIALNGGGLSLKGATTLSGVALSGAKPLYLYGATSVSGLTIGGAAVVYNYATVTQSGGSITVGDGVSTDQAELVNTPAGVWNITDDSGVGVGLDTASFILNKGTLEKTGGAGTSTIAVSVTDTGSIAATSGTLAFAGPSNSFAGAISGSGTVLFSNGGTTFNAGASATIANLSETGSNTTLTFAENLAYAGAFTQGVGSRLIINKTETLTLSGTSSLSGSTFGGGTLALTGGDTTISTGASLTTSFWSLSGSAAVTLSGPTTYTGAFSAGAGTRIALTGGGLSLKGATTLSGVALSGAKPLYLYGATSVSGLTIGGSAIVYNYATAAQSGGSITVGDGASTDRAELVNTPTGVWNIADDSGIGIGQDPASFIVNKGTLEKTGGAGTSAIAPAVTNTGTISVSSGVLDLQGAVTGTGSDSIYGASTLEFDSNVVAGQTVNFAGSGSTLLLDALASFKGTVSGYDVGGLVNDAVQLLGSWHETNFSENAGNTLATLTLSNGSSQYSLHFAGNYSSSNFHLNQSAGMTVIS